MISFRTFRNADPPVLTRIWKSQNTVPGLVSPLPAHLIDRLVLAKPHFDPRGLCFAVQDNWPIAFVHASHHLDIARDEASRLERRGAISMLQVILDVEEGEVASELIERGLTYLKDRECVTVDAGAMDPVDPFYFGIYGAGAPGIRTSDVNRVEWFTRHGFQEIRRYEIRQCSLPSFRPPIDRQQVQFKREFEVVIDYDWRSSSPWEACTLGTLDRVRFRLRRMANGETEAQLILLDMNAISGTFSPRQYAVESVSGEPQYWENGLVTFLIADTVRQLQSYGVSTVTTHVDRASPREIDVWERLLFRPIDESVVLRRNLGDSFQSNTH